MKYLQCREWLEERRKNMGSVPGLDEVNRLLDEFERPDRDLRFIHIAGTNGKGSIGYLLEHSLANNKIKTGRFLSPAVTDEREIILVNGKIVPKIIWERSLSEIILRVEEKDLKATAFEIEFVLSLLIFKELNCELVILECGMGGKLDATNATESTLVDIISSISIDHCNFLGNTLKDISLHKFGIMKPGSKNVVLSVQKPEICDYFDEYIKDNDLKCNVLWCEKSRIKGKIDKKSVNKDWIISYKDRKDYILALKGYNQLENAACVFDTLDILMKEGYQIKENGVKKAFREAKWSARFEIINKENTFVLDGAHNIDAVHRLFENINLYFTNRRLIYIMGMYKDKAFEEVVSFCAPFAKAIVTVTPKDGARAIDAFDLGKCVREYNENVTASDSYEEALEIASLLADKKDVILIFGSLSFMGDFERLLLSDKMLLKEKRMK
ncbi:MAG: bifunctional folylpolyglutamate synthase/dihydrofolate synthase [Lachnospiraceae bacterium]|nr:bifunctional folylpolyglutamate synthase/dihydrofolate synthase [Lachnospiraceae bacterium]